MVTKFDRSKICGNNEPCTKVTEEEASYYHSVGPPYILHASDFKNIMPTWFKYMTPVYKQDRGDIQADMYAYDLAAEQHGIRHVQLDHYMVSCPDCGGEGWPFVDSLTTMSCTNPMFAPDQPRPTFIHAAGHFKACSKGT